MGRIGHALVTAKPRCLFSLAYGPSQLNPFLKGFQIHMCKSFLPFSDLLEKRDQIAIATALSLSADLKSLSLGDQIHSHVIKLGFSNDIFSQNNLIKTYFKVGVLSYGCKVFEEMAKKNLVSWTIVISGAIQNSDFEFGLNIFVEMLQAGLRPNEFALGSVMKACATLGVRMLVIAVHCSALKIGLDQNPFVSTSILNMYVELRDIESAELVFDIMKDLDAGCWNAMIGGYIKCKCDFKALQLLTLMPYVGVKMDKYTFISALKGCSTMGALQCVKQIHGFIIQSKVECITSVMNALVDVYFKSGDKDSALRVFSRIQDKDIISWNTAFSGFSQNGNARDLVTLYHNLMILGGKPNNVTFSGLLRKCGYLHNLGLGLQFYCASLHFGLFDEVSIINSAISMFSRCGKMDMACTAFYTAPCLNINTWNELISGYIINGFYEEGIKDFNNLRELGFEADEYTYSNTLEACCRSESQEIGRQLHCDLLKSGFHSHEYICSLLIKCYSTFGLLDDCYLFFNEPEKLDLVSWGTMISSLVHQGLNHEAFKFLQLLMKAGERPDDFILASILNNCASVAAYQQAKSFHALVIKLGCCVYPFVASALIDAYAKCSDIENARVAFDQSLNLLDVVIYNAMIMAYAHQGLVVEAMDIFEKMKSANVHPSQATFISLISACSHNGLIHVGCSLFQSMSLDYGLRPSPEIYGCLVDMLSRNGYLEDAKLVIEAMPFPTWPAIWRTLLSGCRIYENRALGEWAAGRLLQLFPESEAGYVLLGKVYSESGSWEDAANLRRKMTDRGVAKGLAYSWIET
ncbi:pentatricopeptide repeat-containing protein At4g39530-like [Neltuma alba]|uniref:pentatricopeptide repeat-containing protein At4g39530-like n=1 Tax=Neltuma alba TaxID=207710 RepID=UPI0010A50955|nr:pentatricopeptide repeat-containing protein At4g39530-like [Prosopis alba]